MKNYFLTILSVLLITFVSAQGDPPSNTDFMGGNLKIYITLAVLTIILSFIFLFHIRMDRRLKELEEKEK
jgi:hypothetical protein